MDDIEGPAGVHEVEQFWHLGPEAPESCVVLEDPVERSEGWRSPVFLRKEPGRVLCVRRKAELPLRLKAGVVLNTDGRLRMEGSGFVWELGSAVYVFKNDS